MVFNVASSQRVGGQSFYSTLVPFPIACFILTLVTDLAYWATTEFAWETMSVWLLTIGLTGFLLSVLAGLIDLVRSRTIAGLGQPWLAVAGHVVAFGLSVVNVFVHSRDGYTAVVPEGVSLSFLAVLVVAVTTIMARSMASRTRVGRLA